jgi:hypothetical protein
MRSSPPYSDFAGDVVLPLMGRDLCLEVKARAGGFRELYTWLDGRRRSDHQSRSPRTARRRPAFIGSGNCEATGFRMKTKKQPAPEVIEMPGKRLGELKAIGGSMSDEWNSNLANDTIRTLWFFENSDVEVVKKQQRGALNALVGIAPRDECEGMIAAQLVACHHASMECYRRAMIRDQTFEGRQENLNQANKLSRTYATLLEALNRHRGKGQQKVTVEHVHVHKGGQAIVGNVETGGGVAPKPEEQPHALAYAPGETMPSTDTTRGCVPIARDEKWSMPNARGSVAGRAEGE